jgi:hypothetical protein
MGFIRFVAASIGSAVVVAAALSGVIHFVIGRASHNNEVAVHVRRVG